MSIEVAEGRHGQVERLTSWIASSDARHAAGAELAAVGLGAAGHVDDLLNDTWLRVRRRIETEPLRRIVEGADPVAAFARTTMRNAARDLVRGPRETSLDELVEVGWEPEPIPDGDPDAEVLEGTGGTVGPVDPDEIEGEVVRDTRRGLHARLPERNVDIWVVSAALTTVSLRDDRVAVAADIPVPERESPGWARRHLWAGLAYARQDRCFEKPESGAVRERRSRALKRVETLLRSEVDRTVARISGTPDTSSGHSAGVAEGRR